MANRNVNKEAALSLDALRSCLHYDAETGEFRRFSGKIAGTVLATGYRVIRACHGRFLAHRLAWFYVFGVWPSEIDHINRSKDDNRLANLRDSNRSLNMLNSAGFSTSELGVKNITRKRNNFSVHIQTGGEAAYRKTFRCFGQAVKARNAMLQTMIGG